LDRFKTKGAGVGRGPQVGEELKPGWSRKRGGKVGPPQDHGAVLEP